jgi:hypothetical protein
VLVDKGFRTADQSDAVFGACLIGQFERQQGATQTRAVNNNFRHLVYRAFPFQAMVETAPGK